MKQLQTIRKSLESYLGTSYRRKKIDAILEQNRHLYRGIVLDIGGRDRGNFKKPKNSVQQWIFADIVEDFNPDMLLDVTDMKTIQTSSIDTVNAIELFEHVRYPEKGISECFRILKTGGTLIASTPFLYGIHADPYDFQRWTEDKWKSVLKDIGFSKITVIPMGTCVSTSLDMIKGILRYSTPPLKFISFLFYPILDLLEKMDSVNFIKKSICGKYVGGYFITAQKQ